MDSDPYMDPNADLWGSLKQVVAFGVVALLMVLPPASLSLLRPAHGNVPASASSRSAQPANAQGAEAEIAKRTPALDLPSEPRVRPSRSLASMV